MLTDMYSDKLASDDLGQKNNIKKIFKYKASMQNQEIKTASAVYREWLIREIKARSVKMRRITDVNLRYDKCGLKKFYCLC